MPSARPGKHISGAEVTNVSRKGFWLLVEERELFVPFELFPWFRDVPIGKLVEVTMPREGHLYWPRLDIDLAVDSIEHPERYPLVSKPAPRVAERPSRPAVPKAWPSPRSRPGRN